MQKVMFFTQGKVPLPEEVTAINNLNASKFEVQVRNSQLVVNKEDCDYVAGATVPSQYAAVPRWPGMLPEGGASVVDGQALNVSNSAGDVFAASAIHVEDGEAKWTNLPATHALVTSGLLDGITVTGTGTKLTLTVTDGKVTAAALSA